MKLNWPLFFFGGLVVASGIFAILFWKNSSSPKSVPPQITPNTNITLNLPKTSSPSAVAATTSAFPAQPTYFVRNSSPRGIPILMYHYVGNNPNPADRQRDILSITPDKFDAQLAFLAQNGFSPITLDTLYGIFSGKTPRPKKPIILTFDDGYIDFYTTAAPMLRKYSFPAVAFIPTGLVGGGYYMNWGQIKELQASGLVSFQAHTIHHYNLPSLSYSQQLAELSDSKKTLEAQTGTVVNFVAYPYGASDNNTWRAALEAGFVGGTGTWYGRAASPGINMPRIRISGNINLSDFAAKVGG